MTTDMFAGIFAKAKAAFRGQRSASAPVAVPANVMMSSTQGLPVALPVAMKGGTGAPAPFISQPAEISPAPAKPFLEDIPTKFRFGMQQISIGGHSTSEMGGKGERSGSLVDGR